MENHLKNIRNFCIIAHIDHGKSTLADRFLEVTGTIEKRNMKHGQMLDSMDLEQERGITIKLTPVRMDWTYEGENYILNLIDTPGHVDFMYEVSRSLAACEGAILLIDATQGIQAQTLANSYMAIEHDLTIIPVINKIDLPAADVPKVLKELENAFGIKPEDVIAVSAKDGTNVEKVLEAVIKKVPAPVSLNENNEIKGLIFDSVFDSYRGVVAYVRLKSGEVKRGDTIYFISNREKVEVLEVGYFKPTYFAADKLSSGEVGYIVTGLKEVAQARVGDTVWSPGNLHIDIKDAVPLPGYKEVNPYVFASVFCVDGDDYPALREALQKLRLNDAALTFEPEQSTALGQGFRCGFLGLLHLDIVQERLEREYNLNLVVTAPGVSHILMYTDGHEATISTPSQMPDRSFINGVKELWAKLEIVSPKEYIGELMELTQKRRGIYQSMQYINENRVILLFEIPLISIIIDFYDKLKSISSGYASMNYEMIEFREEDLVKLDILIAGEKVDALSAIVHKSEAHYVGGALAKKLKDVIPKEMFEIAIQAAIGSKVVARETISAYKKDVTAKLYGGDRTRKDKLLNKQKEGKKRMKQVGRVTLPQDAFMAILKK
ncbi:MAG: GTP-binding protein LepA, GTP-binding protein LepA [Candidatus Peregrinibacteria bacterium GW2011_GWF2_38_29]|nr:MAG: GTP-binding protein LepA, GTP-binding protein LepA [Candidatus Peregrinibacteria bacterium GW2011_GWF2_38_29]HBB03029.1 elongation factor 4 [Candidatus Peregrinibacteria bacterium]